jgi:capsular exopolysaccharide synthesis family protein
MRIMEHIDVKIVLRKLLRNWHWFALSVIICLGAGFYYLATTSNEYIVTSTLQLKDQGLADKGSPQEKFLNGFELLASDSELQDEIGVLTSYATIKQSLENLGHEVNYYQYPDMLGKIGEKFVKPIYPAPFKVDLDTAGWHLMYTPVYVSFLEGQMYRVRIETEENTPTYYYNTASKEVVEKGFSVVLDTILSVKHTLKTPYINFSLKDINQEVFSSDHDKSYYFTINSLDDVTSYWRNLLIHEQITEKSNITKLSLTTSVPRKGIEFLKSLNNVYIQNDLKKKNLLGQKTIEFIDFQLQGITDSLRTAESDLEKFRGRSEVIDIGSASNNLVQQLNNLEEKQSQLQVQTKYYQYIADYMSKNDDVSDVVAPSSVGIQDPLLNNLLLELNKLNAEKIGKNYASSSNSPVIQVLDNKIQATKRALTENVNNLIGSNKIAIQENNGRIAELRKKMSRLPENERNLVDIQRRFAFSDNIYNYLLQKRTEAGMAIASNVPDKTVVDAPKMEGKFPVSPNRMFVLLVSVVIGLIIPGGAIMGKEFFQTKIESEDQLKYYTDIPVLEHIAQLRRKETNDPYTGRSYLAHTFRYIRHHIDVQMVKHQGAVVVGITSAKSGDGKTFCSLNLAISYAHSGRKTLLIEGDLHKPALTEYLKCKTEVQAGLGEYLLSGQQPGIVETNYHGLHLLKAGKLQENPSDLLSHPRLAALMDTLKEQYEIIIMDTPPVGIVADYLLLSKYINCTLFIVRHEHTEKDEIKRLDKIVQQHQLIGYMIYNGAIISRDHEDYYGKESKKGNYASR